jgi:hypothetical protein
MIINNLSKFQMVFKCDMLNRTNLLIDLAIFAAFLVAMEPGLTGVPIHEWFALALAGATIVHLLLHWRWMVSVTRKFFHILFHNSRLQYVVDALLFVAFTVVMMTGLMISRSVLPLLHISETRNFFIWTRLHDLSANLTLFLVGLHFALHWDWVVRMSKRYLVLPKPSVLRSRPAENENQPSGATPAARPVEIEPAQRLGQK